MSTLLCVRVRVRVRAVVGKVWAFEEAQAALQVRLWPAWIPLPMVTWHLNPYYSITPCRCAFGLPLVRLDARYILTSRHAKTPPNDRFTGHRGQQAQRKTNHHCRYRVSAIATTQSTIPWCRCALSTYVSIRNDEADEMTT